MYSDKAQVCIMGLQDSSWYCLLQPERVNLTPGTGWTGGEARNLIFSDNASHTVTLSTTLADVPPGSIVRIFNLNTSLGHNVSVMVGMSTLATLSNFKMGEFVFFVDTSGMSPVGKWLAIKDIDSGVA